MDNGNSTGTFSFTPDATQAGTVAVTFLAVDQGTPQLSTSLPVNITKVIIKRPEAVKVGVLPVLNPTVPKAETAEVFVPLTPTPRPTPLPTETPEVKEGVAEESWEGKYAAIFRNRCGNCHGITSVGGMSLETYQQALAGGDNGPAIVPGDPDASLLVQVQSAGNHPGQLTIDELNQVIEWISAGAPER